jgi:hypothetical protein
LEDLGFQDEDKGLLEFLEPAPSFPGLLKGNWNRISLPERGFEVSTQIEGELLSEQLKVTSFGLVSWNGRGRILGDS